ncbi:helix-turn-helix domain-containing protein [Jeotgalibaca sp. MA1X17-3]|uniref:helix-turn-helix domain-containing protein n=1 Tax=Jeotgalibaca sp. MA1X17-3 TaxID=2908211 RepID=UPI001F20A5E6|nr:helix-turn-helix domain-containing protein [Jeotgalibaca sp. MA1X17-3]UJF14995.1 helix-turn-helix domain-containing protein [Jeotgalibaca sp. MA1X17-3]
MEKTKELDISPRLTVYLPPDIEKAVYNDFLTLSRYAVEEATKNVTLNTRYLNQQQLCEYFKCGVDVIREWKMKGLKSFTKGKEIMFDLKDVADFLDTQKN